MREAVDASGVRRFMAALAHALRRPTRVRFTGGSSAVLEGWRATTMDVDLTIAPDDEAFAAIPRLKEELGINIEFAAPDQFIPPLPGWEDRCRFIAQLDRVAFLHYDFYSQALAKVERGFDRDRDDVAAMVRTGLIEPSTALALFAQIEPGLARYPAIDPPTFRRAVERAFRRAP